METNGGQHWSVLHLIGIHRSPHNERPNKVAAAEGGGHLVGWAAEGRPSLCGDLWIPTRCSTGQCCPPLVSTCTTYYTLLVVFPSASYGREVPRYTVHILCQCLWILGTSYHEGRPIHPVPKTMYWASLVSRRTPNTQLSTPQNPVFDPLAPLVTSNLPLSAPQNRVLGALSIAEDAENTVFQNSCFGVSLGSAWDQCGVGLGSDSNTSTILDDPP